MNVLSEVVRLECAFLLYCYVIVVVSFDRCEYLMLRRDGRGSSGIVCDSCCLGIREGSRRDVYSMEYTRSLAAANSDGGLTDRKTDVSSSHQERRMINDRRFALDVFG